MCPCSALQPYVVILNSQKRLDLEGATTRDVQPFFPLPSELTDKVAALRVTLDAEVSVCIRQCERAFPDQRAVLQVFGNLATMVTWMRARCELRSGELWKRPDKHIGWVAVLMHQGMELSPRTPLGGHAQCTIVESDRGGQAFRCALRSAILLFIAPVRRRFGTPVDGTEWHLGQLKFALQRCFKHSAASRLHDILLWMLIVGGIEAATKDTDVRWFCTRIISSCGDFGAADLDSVRDKVECALSGLVWLEELRESGLELLMERIREQL